MYPVYDENEEVYCYLVEFEPEGFMYVNANDKVRFASIFGMGGPYTRHAGPMNGWTKYKLAKNENGEMEKVYETDENGEAVRYLVSPFKMAKIKNERLYLLSASLEDDGCRFPAVKRGDKYVNVISMEEMDHLLASLFLCADINLTPDGKTILTLLSDEELEGRFR